MRFDNHLIGFDTPPGWVAKESQDGNIYVTNAIDISIWVSIELGGVRKDDGPICAAEFAAHTYQDKLTLPESLLRTLDDGCVILYWREIRSHDGEDYSVTQTFVARNQAAGDLQLLMFQVAVPADAVNSAIATEAEGFAYAAVQKVLFYPWQD